MRRTWHPEAYPSCGWSTVARIMQSPGPASSRTFSPAACAAARAATASSSTGPSQVSWTMIQPIAARPTAIRLAGGSAVVPAAAAITRSAIAGSRNRGALPSTPTR